MVFFSFRRIHSVHGHYLSSSLLEQPAWMSVVLQLLIIPREGSSLNGQYRVGQHLEGGGGTGGL
jgi:hypothetical protein